MRVMLGMVEPACGAVERAGVDMRERPRDARHPVDFMPAVSPMDDDLHCREFRDLSAAGYGVPRPRGGGSRPRPGPGRPGRDAGGAGRRAVAGMRQRLMLARTLIPDPRVLMPDEPAGGLDPRGRSDLKDVRRGWPRRHLRGPAPRARSGRRG